MIVSSSHITNDKAPKNDWTSWDRKYASGLGFKSWWWQFIGVDISCLLHLLRTFAKKMAVATDFHKILEIQSKIWGPGFNLYRYIHDCCLQGEIVEIYGFRFIPEACISNSKKTCYGFVLLYTMEGYYIVCYIAVSVPKGYHLSLTKKCNIR